MPLALSRTGVVFKKCCINNAGDPPWRYLLRTHAVAWAEFSGSRPGHRMLFYGTSVIG
jgi:hypothetical protein